MNEILPALENSARRLRSRVMLLLSRASLSRVNDAEDLQLAQATLMEGEIRDNLERIQEYGFTSVPLPGAEALVGFIGGNRDHGLILATDDRRFRLKSLQDGEVALYTDEGDTMIFKRGNRIEVTTKKEIIVAAAAKAEINAPEVIVHAAAKAQITSPEIILNASRQITANTPLLEVSGDVKAGNISVQQHRHAGVQSGNGQTGLPV